MDNPTQQATHPTNHHTHVYDPQLTHALEPNNNQHQPQPQAGPSISAPSTFNSDGSPVKRRPGRPKGSTKKHLLAADLPPKIKRPVGRPRKDGLPAGALLKLKRERETAASQQPMVFASAPGALPGYPPIPYGLPPPGPGAEAVPPPALFQINHSLQSGDNDWADLARSNPNTFLGNLLVALAAPNPVSSAGPSVEEAFKSHLLSLAPNHQQPPQAIPSLYSILKTFWLPSSPAYFSLTASISTARTPSEHRFLYWDPQPLVFNGIACPDCSSPLINKGRIESGPIKVYDMGKPFFVIGCEYVCRSNSCIAATTSQGRKFASTDPAILRSLPSKLRDEFPAKLLSGDGEVGSGPDVWNWRALGVSLSLWNMVIGALRSGLKKDFLLALIWAIHHGVPDFSSEPIAQQQPHSSVSAVQPSQYGIQEENKMDEDEEEEEEEEEESTEKAGSHTVQTLESTSLSDAYRAAWRENTATSADPAQRLVGNSPASAQHQVSGSSSSNYGYHYPFTPYAQLFTNHIVAMPMSANHNVAEGGSSASTSAVQGSSSKRSPRHCSKCGSQECKGKGGRNFCTNPCQDCGKLECKGRNSRRPDKSCTEGWQ